MASSTPTAPAFADLHLLTVLAQTRSYTQAARRLGLSKASVSTRIADLERAAGVPLVRRTTRSVGLTEAGQQLVQDTQGAFDHIAHSFAGVRDLAGHPRGLVRVSAPVALGRQHVAPLLPAFLARYPEIRVELDLGDRFVNLVQEGFDLAVRHVQAPPDTHVAWVLCETRSLLVASPGYLQAHGTPTHPSELATHRCLLYLREGAAQSWGFEREPARGRPERMGAAHPPVPAQGGEGNPKRASPGEGQRVSVTVQGPLRANNSEVIREAVLAGVGIGLLPDFSAAGHLEDGTLVPLLPQWQPRGFFGERIHAIRPWAPQVPRAVQCLVDHLRTSLAAGFGAGQRQP